VTAAGLCDLLKHDGSAVAGHLRHCVIKAPDEENSICYRPATLPRAARFAGFGAEQIVTDAQVQA